MLQKVKRDTKIVPVQGTMMPLASATASKPADLQQQRILPPCASYKEAFSAAKRRRSGYSLIALFAFSAFFTIAFQARLALPTSFLSWRAITFSTATTLIAFTLLLARLERYNLWQPIETSRSAEIMSKVLSTDNRIIVGLYAISGYFMVRLYFGHLIGDTYTDNLFVYPDGVHVHRMNVRQLNEDYLFISLYGIVLGMSFAIKRIYKGEWTVNITNVQQPKYMALKLSLATILYRGCKWSLEMFGFVYVLFLLFDGSMYRLAASLFGIYSKVLDTPIVGFSWLDLYLIARTILAGCLAVCLWETVDRVFDVFFGTIEPITHQYANANELLISGLREKEDPLVQAMAFAELAEISNRMPKRRVALFMDVGKDVNNTAWSQIAAECLRLLDTLRSSIEVEYTGVKPAPAPAPIQKQPEVETANRIQLQDANVFIVPQVDTALLDDRTGTLFSHAPALAASVFKEVSPTNTVVAPQRAPKDLVFKLLRALETKAQRWTWVQKCRAVTAERKTRSIFSNYILLVWSIQALGSLTTASFKEDQYGLVQRDLNKVLNTLLATLEDVEKIIRTPPPAYKTLARDHSSQVLLMEPEAVLLALRDSIYGIVSTFHDNLDELKVERKFANKWSSLKAFRE